MFNKIFQKLIIFAITLFPLVHHNTIFASDISEEKSSSKEAALVELLLQKTTQSF